MKPVSAFSESTVARFANGLQDEFDDVLAVEEPLEIRLGFPENGKRVHKAISITMRTPGDDLELAAGFLFTEGILHDPGQIENIRHCGTSPDKKLQNTVIVDLVEGTDVDLKRLERNFYTTSSCGVCGKSSIEALHTGVKRLEDEGRHVTDSVIKSLPAKLREAQLVFDKTGGLHASGLFDTDGELTMMREDVGRHNALDKVIGAKFLAGETPLCNSLLLVSGRVSFELVQKALMAGIPILAAVGAPSSLAVELAREYGMTVVGFVRGDSFNIYCGQQRITAERSVHL